MRYLAIFFIFFGIVFDAQAETTDKIGRSIVTLSQDRRKTIDSGVVTVTTTTETQLLAAGAAGVFHDLLAIFCVNTSATAVRVDIRSSLAGTVRFPLEIPATDMRGIVPQTPVRQLAPATAWTIQAAAGVTDVRCWMQASKEI